MQKRKVRCWIEHDRLKIQLVDQSVDHSVAKLPNQSINQSTRRSVNQSNNQTTNQSQKVTYRVWAVPSRLFYKENERQRVN